MDWKLAGMDKMIHGTFHFHSTFSHDGLSSLDEIASTLRRRGFSFCVMTEHFEDFDPPKFQHYLEEINRVNGKGDFVLVPGVEVNLSGIDTIIFPAKDYESCAGFSGRKMGDDNAQFSVVAHPSKYRFDAVAAHLARYNITGFEMWNQQADGSHIPPVEMLRMLRGHSGRAGYRYFFGCDLHDVKLTVSNYLSIPRSVPMNVEAIAAEVARGTCRASNSRTGVSYCNGPATQELDQWIGTVIGGSYFKGRVLRCVRRPLRGIYRILPRGVTRVLNNFKNYVRNKV